MSDTLIHNMKPGERASGINSEPPKHRPPPPPMPPRPWNSPVTMEEVTGCTAFVLEAKKLEQRAKDATALAGELVAFIHVNVLRETMKIEQDGQKSYEEIMAAFRKRLEEL